VKQAPLSPILRWIANLEDCLRRPDADKCCWLASRDSGGVFGGFIVASKGGWVDAGGVGWEPLLSGRDRRQRRRTGADPGGAEGG
jgi:hypothetical protein